MALKIRDLSCLCYANNFTLWHYRTSADSVADVSARFYFDDAADMLTDGDMIHVSAVDGGTIRIVARAEGSPHVLTRRLAD